MSKETRVKIEALAVFLIVFSYARWSDPNSFQWGDLFNLNGAGGAGFDIAFARLIGVSIIPFVVALIWYLIRKGKPPKQGTPRP